MKRVIQLFLISLASLLSLIVTSQASAASIKTANHVYSATFVDANGYSTKYQMVCFTKNGQSAYVNVDGLNEKQAPLFNDNHQQAKRLLNKYLTNRRQLNKAANRSFVIKGNQMTISNSLVNAKSSAKIEKGGSSKEFTVRYPANSKQKYQTVVFKQAPKSYQYK